MIFICGEDLYDKYEDIILKSKVSKVCLSCSLGLI